MPVPRNWTGAFLTVSTLSSSTNLNGLHLNKLHSWCPKEQEFYSHVNQKQST